MNPKISIIVPVYKVEKYIHKCIDSILAQTFTDFELILVDDGSPDNCGKICDEYAMKDSRIKVIHKKNGGVSAARNVGIEAAIGEYIGFVDSDDYIEVDMYKDLYEAIINNDADISITGIKEVNEEGKVIYKYLPKKIEFSEILKQSYAWNKLFKKSLFLDNKLYFKTNRYYEDIELIPKLIAKSNNIASVNKVSYNYLKREYSITSTKDEKILDNLWAYTQIKEYLVNENLYDCYEEEFKKGIKYFKNFYINILCERDTKFIIENYKVILSYFSKIEKLTCYEIVSFIAKHFSIYIRYKIPKKFNKI